MAAYEYTGAYVLRPASPVLHMGNTAIFDAELQLADGTAVTADGQTTAIDVEGGSLASWVVQIGAVSGTTPTMIVSLQVSLDGGSSYYTIMQITSLTEADALRTFRRNVYIPTPTTTTASNVRPLVRLDYDAGGTTPSFAITSFLAPPAEGADKGLEALP